VLEAPAVVAALAALVEPGGPPLVAHRAKELMHGLRRLPGGSAVDVRTLDVDTAVCAYLLDPAENTYELPDLARRYLQLDVAAGTAAAEGTLDLDGNSGVEEAGRRAVAVHRLAAALEDGMAARELTELYQTVERPLVRVLARMEEAGVRVDLEFLQDLSIELTKECGELEGRIQAAAGERFNVNSTPQLRKILFEKLGLTPVKKTKTGPSTDADSLQKMAADHPIVEELLRYREVEKLRNTYADALPPLVGEDGRIHSVLNQTVASTGRISAEAPNLQNIPLRTPGGREFRRAFIPDEGCELLVADYSQIELRLLAHLAQDPGLIEAFRRDADVHATTASRVFGVPEAEVAPFQRRFAKVVNFGLAYGMEAYGLAQRMDIPTDQAKEILDAYFASFPNVRSFMESTVQEARSRGYTTTLMGRRRLLPELSSDNFRIRQMGERMAQNAPVQGGAADIFKLAMVNLDAELEETAYRWRSGRMADLGFVEFYEALEVYRELDPATVRIGEATGAAARVRPLHGDGKPGDALRAPLALVDQLGNGSPFARAVAALSSPDQIAELHFALVTLGNRVLSADRITPGDDEAVAAVLGRMLATLDIGVEFLAHGDDARAVEAVRSVPVVRLFRLGVSLIGKVKLLARALERKGPFAALGPAQRREMVALVDRLRQERGLTVLMVSHQLDALPGIAAQAAFVADGRIAATGPATELLTRPPLQETADYLGSAVTLQGSGG